MTGPIYTPVFCSVCGREVGKKKGVQVVSNFVCDDPLCAIQEPSSAFEARDSAVVAAALDNVSASVIAAATGMTRQRVYQIVDKWKQGV